MKAINPKKWKSNKKFVSKVPSFSSVADDTVHGKLSWHDDVIKLKRPPALLARCAVNSPANGEFPSQRPVTRSFDVFFDQTVE